MSTAPKIDPRAFAKQGATHRTETHLPRAQQPAKAVVPVENLPSAAPRTRMGRPKHFEGQPKVRMSIFIPEDTAKRIRHLAIEQDCSPSQLVDEWSRLAELTIAVGRGRKAIHEGRVVDQSEAERRLSKWD